MKNDKNKHLVYGILSFLDENRIYYSLARNRPDAVDILATLIGMRIEISVFEDGHLEYSTFLGNEGVFSDTDGLLSLLASASN